MSVHCFPTSVPRLRLFRMSISCGRESSARCASARPRALASGSLLSATTPHTRPSAGFHQPRECSPQGLGPLRSLCREPLALGFLRAEPLLYFSLSSGLPVRPSPFSLAMPCHFSFFKSLISVRNYLPHSCVSGFRFSLPLDCQPRQDKNLSVL